MSTIFRQYDIRGIVDQDLGEVEDDGAGIQTDRIRQKAIDRGLIGAKEAEEMTNEEAIELLFSPGFSTAENVTDISGRGVGLDVVKSKIESLNGEMQIESKPGEGTRFKIKLPLTLAIIQALMVSVRDEIYAIPLSSVNETTILLQEEIKMIQNQEVMVLRGNVLPLYRLDNLLEVPGESQSEELYVVVVRKGVYLINIIQGSDFPFSFLNITITSFRSIRGYPNSGNTSLPGRLNSALHTFLKSLIVENVVVSGKYSQHLIPDFMQRLGQSQPYCWCRIFTHWFREYVDFYFPSRPLPN
jgi:chemotaxis signal transduction protein